MSKKTIIIFSVIAIIELILVAIVNIYDNDSSSRTINIDNKVVNNYRAYKAINTKLKNNTVAYIPLDDRPIDVDRVKYLAESIGYNLELPELDDYKTYLDNTGKNKYKTQYGNPQELAKWLEKMENQGCNYYIISLDQLFSGGLVGSRYLNDEDFTSKGTDFSYIKKVFEKITNDSNNQVYLFDSIMRLASTVNFMGFNNNDYNTLRAFGSISRKTLSNTNLTIDNIVNNYNIDDNGNKISSSFSYNNNKYNLDENKLNRYLKARERKLKLVDYYINTIKNKSNVFLTISIDDSANNDKSIQKNEINYINKIASNVNRQINIRDGIDEQGMLMFSKLSLDVSNIKLKVKTIFYGDRENSKVSFSSNTYRQNYNDLLKTMNMSETNTNEDFDVLIYTTPNDSNKIEKVSNELLDKYIDNIINHIPTVIIDSQDENGKYLRETLYNKVPMGYLIGYSKWNYFSNSSGVGLSEGIVRYLYLRSEQKSDDCDIGFLKLMAFSFIKDIGYLPNLRSVYANSIPTNEVLASKMKPYEQAITSNLINSNYIADLINYTERGIESINISNYHFPWQRGFEMNFDINAIIGSTKNISINYLNKNETTNNVPIEEDNTNKVLIDNKPIIEEPTNNINNNSNNNNNTNNNVNNNSNTNNNNSNTNNNNNTNKNTNTNITNKNNTTTNKNTNNTNKQTQRKKHYITHYSYIRTDANKNFDYDSYVTRAEFAKWLCLANNLAVDTTFKQTYKDVTINTHNWQYILTATKYGYFIGDNNNNFNPDNVLTRAEAVTTILRVVNKKGISYTKSCNRSMPDVPTNAWYYNDMKKAMQYCIIEGDDNGKFNPNNKTKKIEMIAMINRALKRNHDNLECDLPTSNPFNNVSKNYWGYQHLLEAVSTHTCWYY